MFGIFGRPKVIVQSHWYAPLWDYQTSVESFYVALEEEIKKRRFPQVQLSRVVLQEAGMLSGGREYLRIRRDHHLFDIGTAPFGDCWYYCCRGCALRRRMRFWEILLVLAGIASFAGIYILAFGRDIGLGILGGSLIAGIALLVQAGKWPELDNMLIDLPVFGGIYEVFFRVETYHRQDNRHMFLELVSSLIRGKVEEDALGNGRQEVQFVDVKEVAQPMGVKDLAKDVLAQLFDKTKEAKSPRAKEA